MSMPCLLALFALGTIVPAPDPYVPPLEPRKTIVDITPGHRHHHVVRYFDAEVNVVCYVVGSGYFADYQTRITCVKL